MVKYDSFKEAIEKSELIGIFSYGLLIFSTVLASGMFGIPRFITSDIPNNNKFVSKFAWIDNIKGTGVEEYVVMVFRWIIKLVFFLFSAIFGFIWYIFVLYPSYAWKGIDSLKTLNKNEEWYYENAKNLISMIIFSIWTILLYRSILKYNLIKENIEENTEENIN